MRGIDSLKLTMIKNARDVPFGDIIFVLCLSDVMIADNHIA